MSYGLEGGCSCGAMRYRLTSAPMFVHCCHCTWCQRETGTAFVLNALIEKDRVEILSGEPIEINTPSESGRGQRITRCSVCCVAVWSLYSSPNVRFIRVGTLDRPEHCAPDVHIFTESKQPWVMLPDGVPVFYRFYDYASVWPAETYARLKSARSG